MVPDIDPGLVFLDCLEPNPPLLRAAAKHARVSILSVRPSRLRKGVPDVSDASEENLEATPAAIALGAG